MATKQKKRGKRLAGNPKGKAPGLRETNKRLERELEELKKENRYLRKNLAALIFKDVPRNLDLKPDDGIMEPSLDELIDQIARAGK